jgi:hypothetical protein
MHRQVDFVEHGLVERLSFIRPAQGVERPQLTGGDASVAKESARIRQPLVGVAIDRLSHMSPRLCDLLAEASSTITWILWWSAILTVVIETVVSRDIKCDCGFTVPSLF